MFKWFRNLAIYFILFFYLSNLTGICPCDSNIVATFKKKARQIGTTLIAFSNSHLGKTTHKPTRTDSNEAQTIEEKNIKMLEKAISDINQGKKN